MFLIKSYYPVYLLLWHKVHKKSVYCHYLSSEPHKACTSEISSNVMCYIKKQETRRCACSKYDSVLYIKTGFTCGLRMARD